MTIDAEKDLLRKQIYERMSFRETDELLEIWRKGDRAEWTETALNVVQEILLDRLGEIPSQVEKQEDSVTDLGSEDIYHNKKLLNISFSTTHFHNAVTWSLIAGMFFLRIILTGIVPTFVKDPPAWISPTFNIGTYLLTALLIWWEREHLAEFFIDKLALVILVFGKPYELLLHWLQIPIQYSPQTGFYLLYLPIALGILIILLFSRPKLPSIQTRNWLWLIIGITAGIVVGWVLGFLLRLQTPGSASTVTPQLLFFLPTIQLVHAGIAEEPFFRGFLWGALRKSGWKDGWILVFQTALFMLGHLYYINSAPISFWIVVPVGGLVTGLLAWKSRSIATSMTAHGFSNAVGQLVTYYRF